MMARMQAAARHSTAPTGSIEDMRCGGCGSKVGPDPLSHALSRLAPALADDVVIGLDAPDDAAVTVPRPGRHLVQTVDFFRAFVDDPYVFGEIAANHALSDIYAMGGEPRHALATAVIPPASSGKVGETLFQLLSGARACLDQEGVALIGGHSSEGAEMAFGLSVTGDVEPAKILRKSGLRAGNVLVLTRPLGTGILFAAAMQARARADWIAAALGEMRRSNRSAAAILIAHGATAMTDVTGFGLAGHLGELLNASSAKARSISARFRSTKVRSNWPAQELRRRCCPRTSRWRECCAARPMWPRWRCCSIRRLPAACSPEFHRSARQRAPRRFVRPVISMRPSLAGSPHQANRLVNPSSARQACWAKLPRMARIDRKQALKNTAWRRPFDNGMMRYGNEGRRSPQGELHGIRHPVHVPSQRGRRALSAARRACARDAGDPARRPARLRLCVARRTPLLGTNTASCRMCSSMPATSRR